ncbi:MAG: Rpn family recombination-promoting nuclease/putative transposase, partial [Phaeodactylibacter sp.]|nr:Rpn family recombination-promoting nuclease/putative transposase [Phaeodactylibacter sp.]
MSITSNKPHDEFFKAALGRKELAIAYLQAFLPEEIVQKLKLSELKPANDSYITAKLRKVFSDLVYTCPFGDEGQEILITFLLEHKSQPVKYPHIQLLQYELEIWELQVKQKEPVKPVLPIIFYHGKKKWEKKPFEEYFIPLDESLRKYIPGFEYHLTDLSDFSDEEISMLKTGFLANALLILKHAWDKEYFQKNAVLVFSRIDIYDD